MKYQFNCVLIRSCSRICYTEHLKNILLNSLIMFFYIRCKAVVLLIEYKQRNECVASLDSLLLGLRDQRDFTCNIIYLTFKNH